MLEVPSMQQMLREGKPFSTISGLITRCLFGVFIYLFIYSSWPKALTHWGMSLFHYESGRVLCSCLVLRSGLENTCDRPVDWSHWSQGPRVSVACIADHGG